MAASAEAVSGVLTGGRSRSRVGELAFAGLLAMALLVALVILFVLVADVVVKAWPLLTGQTIDAKSDATWSISRFLTQGNSSNPANYGVWQGIVGSVYIAGITAVVAFPLGIATAIYLEEYAGDTRLARLIDVNIRNLAGVPSVVYGLLGLAVFIELLGGRRGSIMNLTGGSTVLTAGLTIAILVLPIVIITSAEAIRAVPDSLRQGGYGLGATKWQVTRQLVLPAAAPGVLTGTILALSRAIGETAPLIVVGAITGFLGTELSLFSQFTALPVQVFNLARQPGGAFQDVLGPATIVVLLLFTLGANGIAIALRNRFDRYQ
jgi:phosphate transport system permease protein